MLELHVKHSNVSFLSLNFIPIVPPRFVNKMRTAIFAVGEDAQFTCVIQSAPSPKIRYAYINKICRPVEKC